MLNNDWRQGQLFVRLGRLMSNRFFKHKGGRKEEKKMTSQANNIKLY